MCEMFGSLHASATQVLDLESPPVIFKVLLSEEWCLPYACKN